MRNPKYPSVELMFSVQNKVAHEIWKRLPKSEKGNSRSHIACLILVAELGEQYGYASEAEKAKAELKQIKARL